jgi:hypothetical protein
VAILDRPLQEDETQARQFSITLLLKDHACSSTGSSRSRARLLLTVRGEAPKSGEVDLLCCVGCHLPFCATKGAWLDACRRLWSSLQGQQAMRTRCACCKWARPLAARLPAGAGTCFHQTAAQTACMHSFRVSAAELTGWMLDDGARGNRMPLHADSSNNT